MFQLLNNLFSFTLVENLYFKYQFYIKKGEVKQNGLKLLSL